MPRRMRLLDRHTREYEAFMKGTNMCVDAENTFRYSTSRAGLEDTMMKESIKKLWSPAGAAATQLLSDRKILVSRQQLRDDPDNPAPKVQSGGMNKKQFADAIRAKILTEGVSSTELAAEIGTQGVLLRQEMCEEQRRLICLQQAQRMSNIDEMLREQSLRQRMLDENYRRPV